MLYAVKRNKNEILLLLSYEKKSVEYRYPRINKKKIYRKISDPMRNDYFPVRENTGKYTLSYNLFEICQFIVLPTPMLLILWN